MMVLLRAYVERIAPVILLLALLCVTTASAADEPEEAGLIQYTFGQVLPDGEVVPPGAVGIYDVGEKKRLSTGGGLAEVVLAPGSDLRLGGNTEFEMLSTDLTDVRFRLLSGSVLIDVVKKSRKHAMSLLCGEAVVRFEKRGLYRVDAIADARPRLKVFRGQALASVGGAEHRVKGKQAIL